MLKDHQEKQQKQQYLVETQKVSLLKKMHQISSTNAIQQITAFWEKVSLSNQNFYSTMNLKLPEIVKQRYSKQKNVPQEEIISEIQETFFQAFLEEDQIYQNEFQKLLEDLSNQDTDLQYILQTQSKVLQQDELIGRTYQKETVLGEIEKFYSKQDAYLHDLITKQEYKININNKYLKNDIEDFQIQLSLGQQKKTRVGIKVISVELENVFEKDFCDYFLHSIQLYKRKIAQFNETKQLPSEFLDNVTQKGAFINLTFKQEAHEIPSSKLDGLFKFKTELYFKPYYQQYSDLIQEKNLLSSSSFIETVQLSSLRLFRYIIEVFEQSSCYIKNSQWSKLFDYFEENQIPFVFISLRELLQNQKQSDIGEFVKFLKQKINEISISNRKQILDLNIIFFKDSKLSQTENYQSFITFLKNEFK